MTNKKTPYTYHQPQSEDELRKGFQMYWEILLKYWCESHNLENMKKAGSDIIEQEKIVEQLAADVQGQLLCILGLPDSSEFWSSYYVLDRLNTDRIALTNAYNGIVKLLTPRETVIERETR